MKYSIVVPAALFASLILAGISCSRANVGIVGWSAYCQRYCYAKAPYYDRSYWTVSEACSGTVTNTGDKTAFEVSATTRFGSGAVDSHLVDCINLKPADIGHFFLVGKVDTVICDYYGEPDSENVTAEMPSISWK
jgi:hypothetical protein